jgi:hypothetical protein
VWPVATAVLIKLSLNWKVQLLTAVLKGFNMEEFIDQEENKHYLYYGYCRCNVWPLFVGYSVGKCGKCKSKPEGYFLTKSEAMEEYLRSK